MHTITRGLLVAFVIGAVALGGCGGGGGGGSSAPTVDVTGSYTGRWESSDGNGGGAIQFLSLVQSAGAVSGQLSFSNSPCFSGGAVSGVVSGDQFSGSLTAGNIRVDFEATVTGNQMNGTYDTVNAGACTGNQGTFTASK